MPEIDEDTKNWKLQENSSPAWKSWLCVTLGNMASITQGHLVWKKPLIWRPLQKLQLVKLCGGQSNTIISQKKPLYFTQKWDIFSSACVISCFPLFTSLFRADFCAYSLEIKGSIEASKKTWLKGLLGGEGVSLKKQTSQHVKAPPIQQVLRIWFFRKNTINKEQVLLASQEVPLTLKFI